MERDDLESLLEMIGKNTPFLAQISNTLILTQEIYNSHLSLIDEFKAAMELLKDSSLSLEEAKEEFNKKVDEFLKQNAELWERAEEAVKKVEEAEANVETAIGDMNANLGIYEAIKAAIDAQREQIEVIASEINSKWEAIKDFDFDAELINGILEELEGQREIIESNLNYFRSEKEKIIQAFEDEKNNIIESFKEEIKNEVDSFALQSEEVLRRLGELVRKFLSEFEEMAQSTLDRFKLDLASLEVQVKNLQDLISTALDNDALMNAKLNEFRVRCVEALEYARGAFSTLNVADSELISTITEYLNRNNKQLYTYLNELKKAWSEEFKTSKEYLDSIKAESALNIEVITKQRKEIMFLSLLKRSSC